MSTVRVVGEAAEAALRLVAPLVRLLAERMSSGTTDARNAASLAVDAAYAVARERIALDAGAPPSRRAVLAMHVQDVADRARAAGEAAHADTLAAIAADLRGQRP